MTDIDTKKKTKAEEEREIRELQKTKLQLEIYILNWIYSFIKDSVGFDGDTLRQIIPMVAALKNTAPEDMETAIINYLMDTAQKKEAENEA